MNHHANLRILKLIMRLLTHLSRPYEEGLTQKAFANNKPYKRSRCEWDWAYPIAWPWDQCPIPYPIYRPVTGAANALTYGQFVAIEYVDFQLLDCICPRSDTEINVS